MELDIIKEHKEENETLQDVQKQEVQEQVIKSEEKIPLEADQTDGVKITIPVLPNKKEEKRKKSKTIWRRLWVKIRYVFPILLIGTMIIITNSIDRKETRQKKKDQAVDYLRLFQVLEPDTPLYKQWETKYVTRKFYVFNWTNIEEIDEYPNIKPEFEEYGPFVFHEKLMKTNVVFNATNGNEVSFNLFKAWTYNRASSVDDLDAIVTTHVGSIQVRDLLITNKDSIPTNSLPWFYHTDASIEFQGQYKVFTGKENRYEMNHIVTTNNQPLSTIGDLWSTASSPNLIHPLNIYVPEICLTISFDDIDISRKIRRWSAICIQHESAHDQSTVDKCKVIKKIKTCRGRQPLLISFPHFHTDLNYQHDDKYLKNIVGLKPNRHKHTSYAAFELETGRFFEKHIRLQFNTPYKFNTSM